MAHTKEELEQILDAINEQMVVLADEKKALESATVRLNDAFDRLSRNREVFSALLDLKVVQAQNLTQNDEVVKASK